MNLYPMINTDHIDKMNDKMRHALSMFEAANVRRLTQRFTVDEVREFIASDCNDPDLARTFEPRFLFSAH